MEKYLSLDNVIALRFAHQLLAGLHRVSTVYVHGFADSTGL